MRVFVYILSSLEGSENADPFDGLSHGSWVTNWHLFLVVLEIDIRNVLEGRYPSTLNHVCATLLPSLPPCLAQPAAPHRDVRFTGMSPYPSRAS